MGSHQSNAARSATEIDTPNWGLGADEHGIQAWSTHRLQFEPRDWQCDFRAGLRSALRRMPAIDGQALWGEYAAPGEGFSDVENVLLYNVGAAHYGHLVGDGVALRRIASEDDRHRVRYWLAPIDQASRAADPLAALDVPIPASGVFSNSAGAWWSLLRPAVTVREKGRVYEGQFGVDVQLRGLPGPRKLAGLVKPLLDGLISALHVHSPAPGKPDDALRECLRPLGDPQHVWKLLTDDTMAVLGPRQLVRVGKNNVVWNPGDDRCGRISIAVQQTSSPAISATVRAIP